MSGELFTVVQGFKMVKVPARTWRVMQEIYFSPKGGKIPIIDVALTIFDLVGTSIGTRIVEPIFITLLKESGYFKTAGIVSAAQIWRLIKAASAVTYISLQTLSIGREFYGKMTDEARGVERKKEAFYADPGNSNLRVDYEEADRGHAKAVATWLKDQVDSWMLAAND